MKNRVLFWTPRILVIIFIAFIGLFSLDVFGNDYTFLETVLVLFMNLIPSFILIIILFISWKYELLGGILFILAGTVYIILTSIRMVGNLSIILTWSLIIAGPAFLIGILFILSWLKKPEKRPTRSR